MNKKWIPIAVITIFLIESISSSALEINPPILKITGKSGDFVLQSIEIYNDRDTQTVINISVAGISGYYLPKSTYILKPYERRTITIGFTISGSANGFITYEFNGEVLTQIVTISSEKNVIVFPQNPKAGTSIAIISTSDEKATGFLFVSQTGHQYPIMLSGMPITFVNISKDDYGTAMIVLIWEDKSVTYNYINITKAKTTQQSGKLKIDFGGSDKVKYGSTRIITLKIDDEPVKGSFIIIKPDGSQILKDANALGQINIKFDEAGKWTFIGSYNNASVSDSVTVQKGSLSVDIPRKGYIGEDFEIGVSSDEGNYTLETPRGEYVNGEFNNGKISFKPDEAGEYKITINSDGSEAKGTFVIYHRPKIVVGSSFVAGGFSGIYSLKAGKTYTVMVVDYNTGSALSDVSSIIAYHNGIPQYISLVNGIGKFTPKSGYYTLSVNRDDSKYIEGASIQITVSGGGGGFPWLLFITIIVIIALIIVFLYKRGFISMKLPKLER